MLHSNPGIGFLTTRGNLASLIPHWGWTSNRSTIGLDEKPRFLTLISPAESPFFFGVVFFASPFHFGGWHAKPFTRNLEGECARGGMNFVSVLPTISHELSYLSYE